MKRFLVGLAAVTALALVSALGLALAPLTTATAAAASSGTQAGRLLPDAGWHGRAVQEPHRHDTARTSAPPPLAGWSAGPAELGTGTHRAAGSSRVREVQRRLRRLGYGTGPVDGVFGTRTRAAVGWFQRKHGLPVDGRATATTVRHLRARTGATGPAPGPSPAPATPDAAPASPPRLIPAPVRDAEADGGLHVAIPILVLVGLGLTAAGVALTRRSRSAPRSVPPATIPIRPAERPAGAFRPARAIGYVRLAPGRPARASTPRRPRSRRAAWPAA
jgi:peptidoglycan hydrolase-like protein with peptidoglycan-binding domain